MSDETDRLAALAVKHIDGFGSPALVALAESHQALRAENARLREAMTKVTTHLSAYAEYEEIRTPEESTLNAIHRTLTVALQETRHE